MKQKAVHIDIKAEHLRHRYLDDSISHTVLIRARSGIGSNFRQQINHHRNVFDL